MIGNNFCSSHRPHHKPFQQALWKSHDRSNRTERDNSGIGNIQRNDAGSQGFDICL
ncbi:hypothetical protein ACJJIQ_05715 [Microbulbifer sp. ANSA003]|uniref:hypothetical protein n=1 Tax=Microbulbifer sp. ANSA003 TaxID=3243360 RepID=UPI0040420FCA